MAFLLLLLNWSRFNRASLAAGSLFTVIAICSLLAYAIFGSLYLGEQFGPAINSLPNAVYFSVVTMSTVGYGDITPHTWIAKNATVLVAFTAYIYSLVVIATIVSEATRSRKKNGDGGGNGDSLS